jgi:hypothetical protein
LNPGGGARIDVAVVIQDALVFGVSRRSVTPQ